MILRIFGVVVGLLLILSGAYMFFAHSSRFLSAAPSLFTGALFIAYGFGGNEAVAKLLRRLVKSKNENQNT